MILIASAYERGNEVWVKGRILGEVAEDNGLFLTVSMTLSKSSFTVEAIVSPIFFAALERITEFRAELRESIISLSSVF